MTDDLARWLGEQLDEDERRARSCPGNGEWDADGIAFFARDLNPEAQAHIVEHDPARVLREINAKRQLLSLHSEGSSQLFCSHCEHEPPCPTLRLLALPYADHPGYREEWAL